MLSQAQKEKFRVVWFVIQNRIIRRLNEELRPPRAKKIELANVEDLPDHSRDLLGFLKRTSEQIRDDPAEPFDLPAFHHGICDGRDHSGYGLNADDDVLDSAIEFQKKGMDTSRWEEVVQSIAEQMKFAERCFDQLEHSTTSAPYRYGPHESKAILYWDYEAISLKPKSWEFLKAVWGKESASFLDVGEAAWGDEFTNPSTIRSRATKVSMELKVHRIDLQFSCKGERVTLIGSWPT